MKISLPRHRNIMPSRWWNIVVIARKACGNIRLHTDFMILYVQHVEENNKNVSFFLQCIKPSCFLFVLVL